MDLEKRFVNTDDEEDIVNIATIFERYVQINESIEGFEEYVNNDFIGEYKPFKKEMPCELKTMLHQFATLSECGGIRSFFDTDAPVGYELYIDSCLIYNFFCMCEEVGYAILDKDIEKAESLIKFYASDLLKQGEEI